MSGDRDELIHEICIHAVDDDVSVVSYGDDGPVCTPSDNIDEDVQSYDLTAGTDHKSIRTTMVDLVLKIWDVNRDTTSG